MLRSMKLEIKVINLASAKERKKYMEERLSGVDFSFFEGFNPDNMDDLYFKDKPLYLSEEAIATFESHRKAISLCGKDPVLILEDDSTPICENFLNEIEGLLKTNCYWDLMFLGYYENSIKNKIEETECGLFFKLEKFIGMHSYIVNPENKNKILNELGESKNHIDDFISTLLKDKKIECLFVKKKIFAQNRKLPSQIPKKRNLAPKYLIRNLQNNEKIQ
jgi:GR25 family glycosyltransferase involved in LPS biosynthesis